MFNIGLGELFVIALLVLVVVGPERLPSIMREIGKYAYQLRTLVNELTDQFADELRPIQEIQQLAEDLNPIKQVSKVAIGAVEPLQQTVDQVNAANQPSAVEPKLVKPDARPAVKPTAAFRTAPPHSAANPMKVISQAQHATRDPDDDATSAANDS
jgi:sec-independent protein translocase protein TatB